MNKKLTILLVLAFATPALVQARNCTAAERDAANAQLLAIQSDAPRTARILERHLPLGVPTSTHVVQGGPDNEDLLAQEGYVRLHDKDLRTTLWVAYRLTKADLEGAAGKERVNCFRRDPRFTSDESGTPTDYDEPIFDQGHMTNDADLKDDVTEQVNTYMMSNMSPQYCRLNRGVWLSLESLGRKLAEQNETIFIVSGAIFDYNNRDERDRDRSVAHMGSRNQKARVGIPSDYYKIFLRQEGDDWQSIAFLLENNNEAHGTRWDDVRPFVEASMTTVEEIERVSDTSFFPDLPRADLTQNALAMWDLSAADGNAEGTCP